MTRNSNPRLLLSTVREGDYAHAGSEEAIDIVLDGLFSKIQTDKKLHILDVGCGLGGTAAYIYKKTSSDMVGVDIDANAIKHANENTLTSYLQKAMH